MVHFFETQCRDLQSCMHMHIIAVVSTECFCFQIIHFDKFVQLTLSAVLRLLLFQMLHFVWHCVPLWADKSAKFKLGIEVAPPAMYHWPEQVNNSNNAPHIEVSCQESHCPGLADLCTSTVSSSFRLERVGENGRAGTGKEGSCCKYDMCYMIYMINIKIGFHVLLGR